MRPFHFNLETLLKVRLMEERLLESALATLETERAILRQKLADLEGEEGVLHHKMGHLRLENYREWRLYHEHLALERDRAKAAHSCKEAEMKAKERELSLAVQKRKIVEKLKEKHYCRWVQKCEEEERAVLDEIATQNHSTSL